MSCLEDQKYRCSAGFETTASLSCLTAETPAAGSRLQDVSLAFNINTPCLLAQLGLDQSSMEVFFVTNLCCRLGPVS